MSTKRFSAKIEKALNEQMMREAYQAQAYLSYGSWAEVNEYPGIAQFLYKHSHEEREHMFKFLKFINDRGGHAKIKAMDAPPADPKSLKECLEDALQQEIDNSKEIDKIVNLAHAEGDWATFNFGQWFVKEQIEEETLINNLLDKFALASKEKENNVNLYELDRHAAKASQEAEIARDDEF